MEVKIENQMTFRFNWNYMSFEQIQFYLQKRLSCDFGTID